MSGYLSDPDGLPEWSTQAVGWEQMRDRPCLVLLGEPGIGKSTAIELAGLTTDTETRLYLNLRGYSDQRLLYDRLFGSAKFLAWRASDSILELVLDSLDECLVHIKTLAAWLADELRRYPVGRLRLRVACRTAEWPAVLAEALRELWPGEASGEYELAPLRRKDVLLAARMEGLDGEAFLAAVEGVGAVPLAITPNTLGFLLGEFKDSGALPADPVELFRKGCLRLARNPSSSRRASGAVSTLSPAQLISVAERVAAASLFGRRGAVYLGDDPGAATADDLSLSDLAGPDVIDGTSLNVTPAMVREAVETALFSGRSPERMGFAHWTYGEFLAARFCVTRRLTPEQIADLVYHPDSGARPQVVPQLAETAAWLAAMSPELMQRLAQDDPQVLLRTSVHGMDESTRKAVTASLLRLADQEEFFDRRQTFRPTHYDVLRHPGLHAQLEPYVCDLGKDAVARRLAIDIAEDCKVTTLAPALADVVLDSSEDYQTRVDASYAVVRLGDPQVQARLRPLLQCTAEEDPHDQLRGNALLALWPDHLTARELFAAMPAPQQRNLGGAYARFVGYELCEQLRADDLLAALDWWRNADERLASWHNARRLGERLLRLAWDHLDRDDVAEPFAELVRVRIKNYEHVFGDGRGDEYGVELLAADAAKRRRLVKLLVPLLAGQERQVYAGLDHAGLVRAQDDVPWLVAQALSAEPREVKVGWARLIWWTIHWRQPAHLDVVLGAVEQDPVLAAELEDRLRPIPLDSEVAVQRRRAWQDARREPQRPPKPPATHAPVPQLVADRLRKFHAGDASAWWMLGFDLCLTPDSDSYLTSLEYEPDVTKLPGWAELDEPTRRKCIAVAAQYLRLADPRSGDWLGTHTHYRPAMGGYRALRLLAQSDPATLERVTAQKWAVWGPVTLAFGDTNRVERKDVSLDLVRRAYTAAPAAVVDALLTILRKEIDAEHSYLPTLRLVKLCWDDRLVRAVIEFLGNGDGLTATALGNAFNEILPHGGDRALEAAMAIIRNRRGDIATRDTVVRVSVALLNHVPAAAWPEIWSMLQSDPDFGRDLITKFATHHTQFHSGRIALMLPEDAVADLYVWVRRHFPPAEDPQHDDYHAVGTREQIGNFRDALLARLRDRGTKSAVAAIQRISREVPDSGWLRYTALAAERTRLEQQWAGLPPATVLSMAADRNTRAIEGPDQLLRVVLDSLRRLERKLQGPTSAVVDLWDADVPKDEKALSDYVARHLNEELLQLGAVASREPEVRRGQETDIYVDVVARHAVGGRAERVSLVIEVKGCWHAELKTAMETQLKGRYLRDHPTGYGVYLVGWYGDASGARRRRSRRCPVMTVAEARQFFEKQAAALSGDGVRIEAFVLDAGLRLS